ncbi:uncharacterized protein BX663DRAFT_228054 [Cokeromyces recurvatus]|uniref:uncharacterized protein n=1 Tax=Cokeromyces recurvatus TaxID=90255 RepID=UPI00221EB292|nr:uncharacterized protein BX663DRAFT_228054 [Cokeromyces recurvatus]KAI7898897.1 hypothetical protein BX663DRAFT_228054 [Cokeromyces recurvatus]
MSENEGSIKRSIEETTDIDEHKKQKLNYEDTSTFVSKETGESVNTPVAITSTPTGVKARLTKNDLTSVGEEINKKMKQDNTVSADRSKAVTPLPGNNG